MGTQARAASVWQRFADAFATSRRVRWVVLIVAVLLAWLLIFWLVNLPSDSSGPGPASTVVPSNAA